MSRLDSFIRRMQAQRACLNAAAAAVRDLPGPVLELGLGNGRTYDHLRELMPAREVFVFDREMNAHPACRPDAAHLFLGDIRHTLPAAGARLPAPAALAHSDMGTGEAAANARLAAWLAAELPALLLPGAQVVADQALHDPRLEALPPPGGVAAERYFLYRRRRD